MSSFTVSDRSAAERLTDEVGKLPHADPAYVVLVYYDASGQPTFEKKVPAGVNMADHQLALLRDGRTWYAQQQRHGMGVIDGGAASALRAPAAPTRSLGVFPGVTHRFRQTL